MKKCILLGLSLTLRCMLGISQEEIKVFKLNQDFGHTSELKYSLEFNSVSSFNQKESILRVNEDSTKEPFIKNRRNLYSSMWAFASLNYIYADLISLMDKNILSQYQNGVVNDINITPNFLGTAALFMQIPLANVVLPQIIKKEKTLRWVQITSGALMTLVQTSTLFVGKPTPHYAIFSAFEIATTTFITIDAIKWKPKTNRKI